MYHDSQGREIEDLEGENMRRAASEEQIPSGNPIIAMMKWAYDEHERFEMSSYERRCALMNVYINGFGALQQARIADSLDEIRALRRDIAELQRRMDLIDHPF